jgi:hypothetical protein
MPSRKAASTQFTAPSRAETILDLLNRASERDRRFYLREKGMPDYLYKFKKVDLERPGHLEDILINSSLFLSSPTSFNDAFDMLPRVTVEGDLASILQKIESLPAPSEKEKRNAIRRAKTVWREQGVDGIFSEYKIKEVVEALFADTGVFCFSTIDRNASRETGPRSTRMWGLYGDSHRGICLQFQVSKHPAILRRLVRVSYTNEFPTLNWLSPRHGEDCLYAATNKQPCWSYEHEWRYVEINSAGSKLGFDPCFLTGIIIGAKTDEVSVKEVRRLLVERQKAGLPKVRGYRAELGNSSYKVKVVQWS